MNGNHVTVEGTEQGMEEEDRHMSYSCFSKEVQDYARACEQLIGESARGSNPFTEQELELVSYYTDEVIRLVTGKPTPLEFRHVSK
jgi:hypothetical protein